MADVEIASFWNRKHPLYESYLKFESLMPVEGNCQTIEGEVLRAATRIYWDYYNNGFGNNWSGALNFLKEYKMVTEKEYDRLDYYARGRVYGNRDYFGGQIEILLNDVLARVVQTILAHDGKYSNNTFNVDMFDRQEPDNYSYDEEEESSEEEREYDDE